MKRNLYFLFVLLALLGNSCKRDSLVTEPDKPPVPEKPTIYAGDDQFVQKIAGQLADRSLLTELNKKTPSGKIEWDDRVLIGYLGDTLGHLLVPLGDSGASVNNYLHISLSGGDNVSDAELIDFNNDYVLNKDLPEKATRASELTAMLKKGIKLPEAFSANEAKKLISKYTKSFNTDKKLFRKSQDQSSNISLNTVEANCYMRFQIYYYVTNPAITPTMVNSLFYDRFDFNFSGIFVTRVFWPLNNSGGFNHVRYPSAYIDYSGVSSTISGIWYSEVVNWLGFSDIITVDEVYIDDGCTDPGEDPGNPGGGGGGVTPTPENPNPPVCNPTVAESEAMEVLDGSVSVSEDMEITTIMQPTMVNGFLTRKRQYKWTFYRGSLLYMSWKYKSIDVGEHRFNTVTQDWYWHTFAHTGTATEGSTAFTTELTINAPATTSIDLYKIKASVAFPYTVSVKVDCPGGIPLSRSRNYNAIYEDIDVHIE